MGKIYKRVRAYKKSEKGKEQTKKRNKEYRQLPHVKEKSRLDSLNRQYLKLTTGDGSVNIENTRKLIKEQDNKCYMCGCELEWDKKRAVHLDHILPISKGGKHVISNVAYACRECNLSKGPRIT